jgi:adenosylmethionine---8-amino-7-oxononanoate aminotransferase
MSSLRARDKDVIWHPYTPMKIWPEAIPIVMGEGAYLFGDDGSRYIDAISSWWVTLHGHSNPHIARKVSEQLSTLEHCIFAGFTHEPAITLAERLLPLLPGDMRRIFYSDNGSTAVEVALKMALQYWRNKGLAKKRIVAIDGAYHGDTFGAMSVSGRSVFTEAFTDQLFDVTFIPFPDKANEQESLQALTQALQQGDVAAFIAEPLVQGSAGMRMYSPAILEQYFTLTQKYEALIIADEVMTGFGRTGPLFACRHINTKPDIVCLSKGLTGGSMPLGITAATQDIFEAFYDDDRSHMLYHGHSFTANPVMCAAALASLDLLLTDECTEQRKHIAGRHSAFGDSIKDHPLIAEVRQTGTIIAIEFKTDTPSYHHSMRDVMYRFFLERRIIMRPLGNIIYLIPPYCISGEDLNEVYGRIGELLVMLQAG